MVKFQGKICEGIKVEGYFSKSKTVKGWVRNLGGTENMGRNESMAQLLMSIWEGITENRDMPSMQPGFFFMQQRVFLFFRELFCFDSTHTDFWRN